MLAKEILKKYVMHDEPHRIARDTALGKGAWQTIYQFPNGYRVSVVSGEMFYTDETHPYEMMVVNSEKEYHAAPYGHLDEFELLAKLVEVMEMEDRNGIQE
jgi:hypothetical protein